MNYNQFSNLSCYEEFEIQCALTGISKIDILREIGYKIDDHYFFMSKDGIFNWFDLNGNRVENPGILKEFKKEHIYNNIDNIVKCIIPNGVTSIGEWAFSKCESLKEINIPDSVTSISNYAFWLCESLKEIIIPNNVTHIGVGAFSECKSLISIIIPNNVTHIGVGAFSYCDALKEIIISNSVISIDIEAFDCCESLKEIVFKGKTLEEVKQMKNYPWDINDESIIKCEIKD